MTEQHILWREMVAVLHRRRTLILQVVAAGIVTVAIGVWLKAPTYMAQATIMVTANRANVSVSPDADTGVTVARVTVEDLNSEVALLKSDALVREVLESQQGAFTEKEEGALGPLVRSVKNFVTYPLRLPGRLYRYIHGVPDPSALDYLVETIAQQVNVTPVVESNLIRVSFAADSPEQAAWFVNELIKRHIEHRAKLGMQLEAEVFYDSQRRLLGEKLREAEGALQAFYVREGWEAMPEQQVALRTRVAELESMLENTEAGLAAATAKVQFAGAEIRKHPKNVPTSRDAQQFRLLELELQRSQLLSKYAPTSIAVKDIDRQIADAKRLFDVDKGRYTETTSALNPAYQTLEIDLAQSRAEEAALQARVSALRVQVSDHRIKIAHLEEIASDQKQLEHEVTSAREAFITYSKKQEEARFSNALDASSIVNLSIAEPAQAPATPAGSSKRMTVVLGAAMSLMAGIALAFVRDRLDPAVKSAADIRNVTGLPVLAEVSS